MENILRELFFSIIVLYNGKLYMSITNLDGGTVIQEWTGEQSFYLDCLDKQPKKDLENFQQCVLDLKEVKVQFRIGGLDGYNQLKWFTCPDENVVLLQNLKRKSKEGSQPFLEYLQNMYYGFVLYYSKFLEAIHMNRLSKENTTNELTKQKYHQWEQENTKSLLRAFYDNKPSTLLDIINPFKSEVNQDNVIVIVPSIENLPDSTLLQSQINHTEQIILIFQQLYLELYPSNSPQFSIYITQTQYYK